MPRSTTRAIGRGVRARPVHYGDIADLRDRVRDSDGAGSRSPRAIGGGIVPLGRLICSAKTNPPYTDPHCTARTPHVRRFAEEAQYHGSGSERSSFHLCRQLWPPARRCRAAGVLQAGSRNSSIPGGRPRFAGLSPLRPGGATAIDVVFRNNGPQTLNHVS